MSTENSREEDSRLLKQVNASGFPFQIRVQHEVEASYREHGWRMVASEHQWDLQGPSGRGGFIDLVLGKKDYTGHTLYMTIECKRSVGGSWVFLQPVDTSVQKNDISAFVVRYESEGEIRRFWVHAMCDPESPMSSFCAVPGQADKATPMLERIAGDLLLSMEGLSYEVAGLMQAEDATAHPCSSTYIPVLVTSTTLMVCRFEPTEVGLVSGVLEDNEGGFEPVPFVRFRKSLSTTFPCEELALNLQDANREGQRTILVVHAPQLIAFLRQWGFR